MIQVIYGAKGTGKTKRILSIANDTIESSKGSVVFLDDDKNYMYDLKNAIRFINMAEYPSMSPEMFIGFIYGMAAQDFDIEHIFIDGLLRIMNCPIEKLDGMFNALNEFSEKHGIAITISINGADSAPAFIKPYMI